MTVITLQDVGSLQDATTAQSVINANSAAITSGLAESLAKTGDQMVGNIDMDSNRILNLPAPASLDEPLRLADVNTGVVAYTAGTGISIAGTTITNTEPFVGAVAGTGISVTGSTSHPTISTNLTAGTGISITGATISTTATPTVIPTYVWYVNASTGSDSNNGQSSGTAFATLRHAVEVVSAYSWSGITSQAITINLAAGSYAGFELTGTQGMLGDINVNAPYLLISGAGHSSTTITNSTTSGALWCVEQSGGTNILFENLKFQVSTSAGHYGLFIQNWSQAYLSGTVEFSGGSSSAVCMHGEEYSLFFNLNATTIVSGTFNYVFQMGVAAEVEAIGTVNMTGTVTSFANLDEMSVMRLESPASITGSCSGPPVYINGNSYLASYYGLNLVALSSTLPVLSNGGALYLPNTPTISGILGIGSSGTVTLTTSSSTRAGSVYITPGGSGIASTGQFNINFSEQVSLDSGGAEMAPYFCNLSVLGTGTWATAANARVGANSGGSITIHWDNNGNTLGSGSNYYITYGTP